MSFIVRALLLFILSVFSSSGQAQGFKPFNALSKGSDCRIVLDFPDGDFCGVTVPVDAVRSWYYAGQNNVGDTSLQMLMGFKFDFDVIVNSESGVVKIPVRFLNPATAKRFYVQMGAWTGEPSADGGPSPFPASMRLGD